MTSALGVYVGGPFGFDPDGPGGRWSIDEPELHLDVLVPELAGWTRQRTASIPDVAAFELAPDWVCEVLSPSTESLDRKQKLEIYARERVSQAWLADPRTRTLEVLRLDPDGRRKILAVHKDDACVRAEPFESVEIPVGALWL